MRHALFQLLNPFIRRLDVTDLAKKELAIRDKVKGEGEDAKDITYVVLTDAGLAFVPSED